MLHVRNDERNTPITAVPGDDVARLLATCTSKRDRVAVLLATEAGLRIGEILGVQWTDIKDGCVTVRRQIDGRANVTKPKHDVVRTVPLSPALVSALGALPRRGIWIVCKRDGASLAYQGIRYMLVALYERAGVTIPATDAGIRRPWHSLRHYFGTTCAARGVPIPVLQQLMGHKDITTTMIYVDVHEDQKQAAIALAFGSTPRKATGGQQSAE